MALRQEGAKPLTSHRSQPRIIFNSCQTSSTAPSHLGDDNHQEKQESRSKRTPKCQLDANSQANALEITQSHFIRQSSKGDEWEGMCSAQKDVRESKCPREIPKDWPTSIYKRPNTKIAVRHLLCCRQADQTRRSI
jgi:hypothetical protein